MLLPWIEATPGGMEWIGMLINWLDDEDPRPAAEQLGEQYPGGWVPFHGHTILPNGSIQYPGDPPLAPAAFTKLRQEIILVYPYSWVAILRDNGSHEIMRMD